MSVVFNNNRNDRLNITGLSQSLAGFTACWWFRVPTTGTKNTFATHLSFENTAGSSWLYVEGADSTTIFKASLSGTEATFPAVSLDTWYWMALVKAAAGNTVTGYQELATHNGTPSSRFSSNLGAAFTFNKILLGENDVFTGETFRGNMAGVKIWSSVQTAADLALEKRQLAPFRTQDLYAFWPLHSEPLKLRDDSGNARPLVAPAAGAWTTDDGPPVPWRRGRSRFFVPASASGTTGTAALSASVSVAAVGTPVGTGTAALSTSVTVAAAGTPVVTGDAAVSTSVSVAAAGSVGEDVTGTVALSTSVSVAAAGTPVVAGTAALSTSVAAASAGAPVVTGAAALSVSAAVAASGTSTVTGAVSVATSVGVVAAGDVTSGTTGTVAVSTSVTAAASGTVAVPGTASLTTGIAVLAAGNIVVTGAVALSTSMSLSAAGYPGTLLSTLATAILVGPSRTSLSVGDSRTSLTVTSAGRTTVEID